MRLHYTLALFVLLSFGSCSEEVAEEPIVDTDSVSTSPVEPAFSYAVWGHGPGDKSDEELQAEFQRFRDAGITDFYIGAGPEQLERLVRITNAMDINIHGWIWTLNRPGDTIAQQHPEWYAVNREGRNSLEYNAYVGYYQWLSPFSPGAREHIKNNITKVAEVDGIASVHLDYVRYVDVILGKALQPKYDLVQDTEMPPYDYGYHPIAREQFKEIFGEDPMETEHPELSNEWRQFRLNAVTNLVNELSDIAHDHDKKISAAVFPYPELSRMTVRQDWSSWHLDIALPMIYQNFYEQNLNWIEFATQQGVNEVDGRFPIITGLYIPSLSPAQLDTAIQKAKAGGAEGVSLFDMRAITDEHLEVVSKALDK